MVLKINSFFKLEFVTLKSILTFNIETRDIVSILGESGSGKSTLLKCIAGLVVPKYSFLSINDFIYQDSRVNLFISPNLRKVGYVFQNPYLYPHLNVFENITLGLCKKNVIFNVLNLIDFLKLNKIKKRGVMYLSDGEKQRIALAQVILSNPSIILLDEVLSNQDFNMKMKLLALFKKLHYIYNKYVIYVSHDIMNLETISKSIIYINKGKRLI